MTFVSIKKNRLVIHVEDHLWLLFGGIIFSDLENACAGFLLNFFPFPKSNIKFVFRIRTTGDEEIIVGKEVN